MHLMSHILAYFSSNQALIWLFLQEHTDRYAKIMNDNFVSKLTFRGVVISLTLFYLTNIPKTPVLSAFPVLYYSQSKKPNGN